jgi:hypothetical protein
MNQPVVVVPCAMRTCHVVAGDVVCFTSRCLQPFPGIVRVFSSRLSSGVEGLQVTRLVVRSMLMTFGLVWKFSGDLDVQNKNEPKPMVHDRFGQTPRLSMTAF